MLHVHRSERADHLVAALGDLLSVPLEDPFAAEVVAVPTRGVERWLTQRLSHRLGTRAGRSDGVCANVEFPFPGSLVGRTTALACGIEPDDDPWPPERSVWPLLEVVDRDMGEEYLEPLSVHLRGVASRGSGEAPRRFATVRHIADLFDRYAVHRPEMLQAWLAGDDGSISRDRLWQPELWRRLRSRIGLQSPAERFGEAAARVSAEPGLLDLPDRLSLFGLTRLPASHLQILEGIAAARDVHLFLLHPSGALWDKVAAADSRPVRGRRRSDDHTASAPANPLLRSWGRDAREMQLVLRSYGVPEGEHRPVLEERPSLLGYLQAAVRGDADPPGRPAAGAPDLRPLVQVSDESLRVHACHGRARQVEVVRDAILHLLERDPTLEARDVIVMCPDIEAFAPLVQAAFAGGLAPESTTPGESADDGTPLLRVRLADRSLRQTNALLAVAAHLLAIATGRVAASQVLDLVSREPVARRFRLDEDDLSTIEDWVDTTGIRWGIDAEHRRPWRLDGVSANTWQAGMDRLMLGVAMAEEDERLFGGVLPLDGVPSVSIDLAGRLAEFVARLGEALDSLSGRQPVGSWAARLAKATESLAASAPDEAWQLDQLRRLLGDVESEAGVGGPSSTDLLDITEVRSLLDERLKGRPTRANFRTGDLTICTLVPMRSVPHRVVCLLGLDDGAFPRRTAEDGDDLLLAEPFVGDRDPKSEDRQLILDALLAATEHVIVTYEGRDQRTNQGRPPAVPVAELLDVIDRTVRLDRSTAPRTAVLVHHPLQSFDPRNFIPGAIEPSAPGEPWSFDGVNLAGAEAQAAPPEPRPPFIDAPLPRAPATIVPLESLVRFLEHPVRAFMRDRLGLYLRDSAPKLDDVLPIELDGLERWQVGDRLLRSRLDGAEAAAALEVERARGILPPGELGLVVLEKVCPSVEAVFSRVRSEPDFASGSTSLDVNVTLPSGRTVVGTVPDVRGATLFRATYSRISPKHRLAAWARLLALTASRPELAPRAVTIGRGYSSRGEAVTRAVLEPLSAEPAERLAVACEYLDRLLDLYESGLREPLPLYCATSAAWAAAFFGGDEDGAESRAADKWESPFVGPPAEDRDAYHVALFGDSVPFRTLLAEPPTPAEAGRGWARDTSRFGRLAHRLWDPLLEREQLETKS